MHELGIFTGGGGFALAGRLLGWRSLGYVDFDDDCCRNVEWRVNDGTFSAAPVFNCDVRDFVRLGFARHYRGMVDVVTAGFPCQPFSVAGKRLGENDPRNMWPATVECIRVVRPEWLFLENVAHLRHPEREDGKVLAPSYLGRVFLDLAKSGFDIAWDCIPAEALGARHERDRIWIVAHANSGRQSEPDEAVCAGRSVTVICGAAGGEDSDADRQGRQLGVQRDGEPEAGLEAPSGDDIDGLRADVRESSSIGLDTWAMEARQAIDDQAAALRTGWWAAEPAVGRVVDGMAGRAYRIRALGEGLVPAVARCAWLLLSDLLRRVKHNT